MSHLISRAESHYNYNMKEKILQFAKLLEQIAERHDAASILQNGYIYADQIIGFSGLDEPQDVIDAQIKAFTAVMNGYEVIY